MSVCPACKSAPLTQQKDKRLFVCSNPECSVRYFTLINRMDLKERVTGKIRRYANCGRYLALLPSGLCEECARIMAAWSLIDRAEEV